MARPASDDHPRLDSGPSVMIYDPHARLDGLSSDDFVAEHRGRHQEPTHRPELLPAEQHHRRSEPELEVRRKGGQRRRGRRKARSLVPSSRETRTDEHVGDSFSGQLSGRTRDKGKSPTGVLVEKDLVSYRHDWEKTWGDKWGSFEFYSCVRAMLFTCKRTPPHAGVKTCLQIFSIRVMEISDRYLQWPLEVYGLVATRDSVDHNRNIIFRLRREACQLFNQQDQFLALTGPAHAIIFTGPVDIEIQLKVKGRTTEDEDKDLISKVLVFGRDPSDKLAGIGNHHIVRTSCFGELCSLEVTSALIAEAVEATVISAEVIEGLWPPKSGVRVVSRTASIDEDLVLLDARDGTLRVDPADGVIPITRNVVCVENDGTLNLSIEAYRKSGRMYAISATELIPKRSSASTAICKLPFYTVEFTVAWSCLVAKVDDLRTYGI